MDKFNNIIATIGISSFLTMIGCFIALIWGGGDLVLRIAFTALIVLIICLIIPTDD